MQLLSPPSPALHTLVELLVSQQHLGGSSCIACSLMSAGSCVTSVSMQDQGSVPLSDSETRRLNAVGLDRSCTDQGELAVANDSTGHASRFTDSSVMRSNSSGEEIEPRSASMYCTLSCWRSGRTDSTARGARHSEAVPKLSVRRVRCVQTQDSS